MQILKEINPNGTEERKQKKLERRKYFSAGSNATWHMDGFDSLNGFPIHGCVDVLSRKIMWLKLKRSNNNLVLPASYYLETESALKLCPTLWQTDCGNENNITAGIQCHIANDISAHMAPHKVSWIMVSFIQEILYIWNVLGFHFLNYYKVN